jgi:hypothetical protein
LEYLNRFDPASRDEADSNHLACWHKSSLVDAKGPVR